MKEPRHSRLAFWTVKLPMLLFAATVLWNVAKESGREEIRSMRPVKFVLSGNPMCIWGDVMYPATELNTKKMSVKIKRESK